LEYKYLYRRVRKVAPTIKLKDGDEIMLGGGAQAHEIQMPDPKLCNLKLALIRVLNASGAADAIDELMKDYEDSNSAQTLYFGCGTVSDDLLMEVISMRTSNLITIDA
jgi:hypothetical protein